MSYCADLEGVAVAPAPPAEEPRLVADQRVATHDTSLGRVVKSLVRAARMTSGPPESGDPPPEDNMDDATAFLASLCDIKT